MTRIRERAPCRRVWGFLFVILRPRPPLLNPSILVSYSPIMTIPWLGLSARVAHFLGVTLPAETDFEVGVEAYDRGDYDTALNEFRPLAEQGHPKAQYNLGVMYAEGLGVQKDYVLAHMWLNLAAVQGIVRAPKMREFLEEMTPAQLAVAK